MLMINPSKVIAVSRVPRSANSTPCALTTKPWFSSLAGGE
jgi:hypothetical protein